MNLSAIAGNYVIPKGFLWARFGDNDHFEELGDTDGFTIQIDATRDDRKDNRFGVARVSDSQVTDVAATISMTLMQHTNRNRSLGVMGSMRTLVQTSATATEVTFIDAKAKQGYWLGRFDISNLVVTDGAATDPETYVSGTDYLFDARSGFFQPLKDFATLVVTFDSAAIAETKQRLKTGIGGNPDIQCELIHVGNAQKGEKPFVRLWSARLTPSSARGYIGSERQGIEITGTLQIDTDKAQAEGDIDEFAFGYETTLAA